MTKNKIRALVRGVDKEWTSAEKKARKKLKALGEQLRREVVIPACKKYGLVWFQGYFYVPSFRTPNGKCLKISSNGDALREDIDLHKELGILEVGIPFMFEDTPYDVAELIRNWGPDPYHS